MYCTYWNGIFAWSVFFSDRFGSWKWTNLNCWKISNCSHSWGFCRGVTQWKRRSWEQWWTMVVKLQERYCTCCSVFIFRPSYPESTIYEYNFGKLTQGFSDIVFYSVFWLGEPFGKTDPGMRENSQRKSSGTASGICGFVCSGMNKNLLELFAWAGFTMNPAEFSKPSWSRSVIDVPKTINVPPQDLGNPTMLPLLPS